MITAAILGVEIRSLLVLAGVGQLTLVVASLAIPRVLGWPAQLSALPPMTRQVFWTYAAYVCGAHLAFGLVSLLAPDALLNGTALARATCAFIAVWWTVRLLVAVFGCEARELPRLAGVRWAHRTLLLLFVSLALGYACIATGFAP